MGKPLWIVWIVAALVLLLGVMAACSATGQPTGGGEVGVPANPGKQLVEERCTVCHELARVEGAQKTRDEWQATVERMVGHGAALDAGEQKLAIDYLTEAYPK